MRISIFGAGYVGTVTGACLASGGHDVRLVDIDVSKIEIINQGLAPFFEPQLSELLSHVTNTGKLRGTSDTEIAIHDTDISLVCVGTPSDENGRMDSRYLEAVCQTIGETLKKKPFTHTVIFRSTMPPGTVRDRLVPLIEKASGKICGEGFYAGYNPEFLREGSAIADYFMPTQIVAGARDKITADTIMKLYDSIEAPRSVVSIEEAEAVKYVSNIWRAQKIAFANEIGDVLHGWGVDPHKVMDVIFQDRKINLGPAFLQPGFAYGGSCLPKDIRAAIAEGKIRGLNMPVLDAIEKSNCQRITKAKEKVKEFQAKRVLFLGASFKPGTDDLRESPYVTLAHTLKADYELQIYDVHSDGKGENLPWVDKAGISPDVDLIILSHDVTVYWDIIQEMSLDIPILALARPQCIPPDRSVYGLSW